MGEPIVYHMTPEECATYKSTGALPFVPLETMQVNTAQTAEYYINNIKENLKTHYPLFEHLQGFQVIKGSENPIALVGGGPSLKSQLNELRKFKVIMACGSCHDFLIEQNIIPTYASMIDPDDVCAKYLTKANKNVTYLIASSCHPKVFEQVKDCPIAIWHCHSEDFQEEVMKLQPTRGYLGIGGGCTVGMRSIGLAMLLGYNNIHFFGFDSCIPTREEHHAYGFADYDYEIKGYKDIRPLKFAKGTKWEKDYLCVGYQIAQAVCFRDYFNLYGACFTPTFHGGGLLSDLFDFMTGRLK